LAFDQNNLEFPLTKDDLYQVWLNLACWFWRFFFRLKHKWIWFSLMWPLPNPGDLNVNNSESTLY
jgi:hypothetical protein